MPGVARGELLVPEHEILQEQIDALNAEIDDLETQIGTPTESDVLDVKTLGAVGDGVTDDTLAIQTAITTGSAQGRKVYMPPGNYLVSAEITCPSNTHLFGAGMGLTRITVASTFPNTDAVFANPTYPSSFLVRGDENYFFADFSVNGDGRNWNPYLYDPATGLPVTNPAVNVKRNPDWAIHGYILNFRKVTSLQVLRVEVYNHRDVSCLIGGCLNVRFLQCRFHHNGRVEASTDCIHIKDAGVMKKIVGITNAADGVITTDAQVGSFSAGDSLYLQGIEGMNLPDGIYSAKSVTGNAVITIEDNTTSLGTFKLTGKAKVGKAGWCPAEDTVIQGCHFKDNLRQAIGMIAGSQGLVLGNYSENSGECGVFALRGDDVKIVNNTFRNVTLRDISGHCIEANLNTDLLIQGNLLDKPDLAGIAHFGGIGTQILNNTIRNCSNNAALRYPYGPDSENYITGANYPNATPSDPQYDAGLVVSVASPNEYSAMQISNFNGYPVAGARISGNRIIQTPFNPDILQGISCASAGTPNIATAITIDNNDFSESAIPGDMRVNIGSDFLLGTGELHQRDNVGLVGAYVDSSITGAVYGADYRVIFRSSAQATTAGASGKKYLLTASNGVDTESGVVQVLGASQRGLVNFYWRGSDYAFPSSIVPYFKITGTCVAGSAPGVTALIGLYPYTISGGIITLGTSIASITSGTIVAQDTTPFQNAPFSAPADGSYILGYTLSGTPANIFNIQATVQVKGVARVIAASIVKFGDLVDILLVIGIILSNVCWLIYIDKQDHRARAERKDLLNRIAHPEIIIPPDEVVEANVEAFKASYEEFNEEEALEAAAVGNVNPTLRRSDG